MITGTGFMVSDRVLRKLGGWNSATISEDLELTAQCVLAGERVWWAPRAITYDEQPLTWGESLKQRRRWTSGTLQVAGRYLPLLARALWTAPSLALADLMATPADPPVSGGRPSRSGLRRPGRRPGGRQSPPVPCWRPWPSRRSSWPPAALTATGAAALVLTTEGKWDRRMLPALGAAPWTIGSSTTWSPTTPPPWGT